MHRINTTVLVAITAVLAALLIAYVFLSGDRAQSRPAPHCTSKEALDQIRTELFRRAAGLRGTTDPTFNNIASYSVVRTEPRVERRRKGDSGQVSCTGTIVLDLPPGLAAVGGRRSLRSKVTYRLQAQQPGGAARLVDLSKADAIVVPLASIGQVGTQPAQQPVPETDLNVTNDESGSPAARPGMQQPARSARVAPPPIEPPPPPKKRSADATAKQPPPARVVSRTEPRRMQAPVAAPAAVARPSFNCRYARTRGEIAVCRNSSLASLDRQMAGRFYSAVAAARPGQRKILERTRTRFLRYRDSCGSEACIADAYQGRIREIGDIMAGNW